MKRPDARGACPDPFISFRAGSAAFSRDDSARIRHCEEGIYARRGNLLNEWNASSEVLRKFPLFAQQLKLWAEVGRILGIPHPRQRLKPWLKKPNPT